MLAAIIRHLLYRQRLRAALAWRDAERARWAASRGPQS